MAGFRARLTDAAWAAARGLGLHRLARNRHRESLLVLCYHGVVDSIPTDPRARYTYRNVVDARRFELQMRHVGRCYHPVSLGEVEAAARGDSPLPERALLVTFDDGYRNNLDVALPILERCGIPALVSVTTDHVDGTPHPLWPMEVDLRILDADGPIPWPGTPDAPPSPIPPRDDVPGRIALAKAARARCKAIDDDERRSFLEALRDAAPICTTAAARDAFLDWDGVRTLHARGIAIGSHTVTHPILSRVAPDALRVEVEASKARIEEEIDAPCTAFVYPNGSSIDMTEATRRAIERAGYDSAFALRDRVNEPGLPDRLAIDRISMPNHVELSTWSAYVSGLRSMLPGSGR